MKITLLADDAIRLDPTPGPLTIEATSAEMQYSPFHMLASGLATCTFSVLHSWATHARVSADDITLEVQWKFADDPHRVSNLAVMLSWPSLPAARLAAARRVAELCTIHATLTHSPSIEILAAGNGSAHEHDREPVHKTGHEAAPAASASSESDPATVVHAAPAADGSP